MTDSTIYLHTAEGRKGAILNDLPYKIYFEHQEISQVASLASGVFENFRSIAISTSTASAIVFVNLQKHDAGASAVSRHASTIEAAAQEFGLDPDFLKAVIYTENARGWYDGNTAWTYSVRPANISSEWDSLVPGAHVTDQGAGNIRIAAKLLAEIAERLDNPYPEDVYALYNSLAHDRTYENAETKTTPYVVRRALEEKAWEKTEWHIGNDPAGSPLLTIQCFSSDTLVELSGNRTAKIDSLNVGDEVLAFHTNHQDGRGTLRNAHVSRLLPGITTEWIELGDGTRVTPNHRYLTPRGTFEPIVDILAGDGLVVAADGGIVKVTGRRICASDVGSDAAWIEQEPYMAGNTLVKPAPVFGWRTYNFEVEGLHTYVAGGLRVHNDCVGANEIIDAASIRQVGANGFAIDVVDQTTGQRSTITHTIDPATSALTYVQRDTIVLPGTTVSTKITNIWDTFDATGNAPGSGILSFTYGGLTRNFGTLGNVSFSQIDLAQSDTAVRQLVWQNAQTGNPALSIDLAYNAVTNAARSATVTEHSYAPATDWFSKATTYDTSGSVTTADILYKTGLRETTDYDTAGSEGWTSKTVVYGADGKVITDGIVLDNGAEVEANFGSDGRGGSNDTLTVEGWEGEVHHASSGGGYTPPPLPAAITLSQVGSAFWTSADFDSERRAAIREKARHEGGAPFLWRWKAEALF